jgi:hypothetical protein
LYELKRLYDSKVALFTFEAPRFAAIAPRLFRSPQGSAARGGRGQQRAPIDNILTKRRSAFDLDGSGAISIAERY